jgi:ribosomal protein S6
MKSKVRHYETILVFNPILSKNEINNLIQSIHSFLKNRNMNIVSVDPPTLKKLSYNIKGKSSGMYYTIEFSGDDSDIITDLISLYRRNENIIRFSIVSLNEHEILYRKQKRDNKRNSINKVVNTNVGSTSSVTLSN